ncbi:MAG: T9SS type A sorting domain-containing protein [Bacteroidales bacterium]
MKKHYILIIVIFTINIANAQWTNKTMIYGSLTRSYRVYQSPNYNASVPASLLIALHGLGDNMTNFSTIGFNYIADTANIICVFPQAVSDPYAGTAWNSGAGYSGYYPNTTVDDIGFINAIIIESVTSYSIDNSRVYLCGFSMGGFMTEKMALQSNSKIAAFASMSGTIGSNITTYNPGRHLPIAHFHGTSDSTVYYSGNLYGIDADSLLHFWINNNACDTTPTTYTYPNYVNDNITIERFQYSNGNPQSDVWFYKMYGAGHSILSRPSNDINEVLEVWLFFRRYTNTNTVIYNQNELNRNIQIYPNPASDKLCINLQPTNELNNTTISIFNIQGQLLLNETVNTKKTEIDISQFARGIYVLKISNNNTLYFSKFIKE